MKKLFFIISILALISCAKKGTYKCECGQQGTSTVTYTTEITNATKSNASDLCYKAAGANSGMPANSYVCNVTAE